MARNALAAILLSLTLLSAGCSGKPEGPSDSGNGAGPGGETASNTTPESTAPSRASERTSPGDAFRGGTSFGTTPEAEYGYTYGSASGNRLAGGAADLPGSETVETGLGGTPVWVAGVSTNGGTAWVAILEDGSVEAFRLTPGGLEPARITPRELPPGAPPLLVSRGGDLELVTAEDSSGTTHPVPLAGAGEPGGLLVIGEDGGLSVERGGGSLGIPRAPAALPDARAVRGPDGDLAILTSPTARYDHGVLGDGLEAGTITVLRPTTEGARVSSSFPAESGGVFEDIAPLWFERGGQRLLAVTESAAGLGSRVSVYCPSGELVGAGPFVGEGMRWRHLTAAASFGPEGEMELSATLTPHVGGVAQFYGIGEDGLNVAAGVPGYASHRIYSRNLDAALAGDLDADGQTELLLPDSSYTSLGGLTRTPDGARTEWSLPVGGELSTNLASATGPDGRAVVAAGRSDGVLRIWR